MINSNFFLGYPYKFKDICNIYPPKIKEIIETPHYPIYKKILLSSQEDIIDEYADLGLPSEDIPTPFEYMFKLIEINNIEDLVKESFYFFIKEEIIILKDLKIIVIGNLNTTLQNISSIEELRLIKEENFFEFQNLLRSSIGEKTIEEYNPNEHPKVAYFKAKARLRDKVKEKSKENLTLGATLASICCMNFGLNPLNIGELSQCAVSILIRYFQEKEKYEIDIKTLLAGGDSNKIKPQQWIRNLEDL